MKSLEKWIELKNPLGKVIQAWKEQIANIIFNMWVLRSTFYTHKKGERVP